MKKVGEKIGQLLTQITPFDVGKLMMVFTQNSQISDHLQIQDVVLLLGNKKSGRFFFLKSLVNNVKFEELPKLTKEFSFGNSLFESKIKQQKLKQEILTVVNNQGKSVVFCEGPRFGVPLSEKINQS